MTSKQGRDRVERSKTVGPHSGRHDQGRRGRQIVGEGQEAHPRALKTQNSGEKGNESCGQNLRSPEVQQWVLALLLYESDKKADFERSSEVKRAF